MVSTLEPRAVRDRKRLTIAHRLNPPPSPTRRTCASYLLPMTSPELIHHLQLMKYMKLDQRGSVMAEYIWIDGSNGVRTKTKVCAYSDSVVFRAAGGAVYEALIGNLQLPPLFLCNLPSFSPSDSFPSRRESIDLGCSSKLILTLTAS